MNKQVGQSAACVVDRGPPFRMSYAEPQLAEARAKAQAHETKLAQAEAPEDARRARQRPVTAD